MFKAMDIGIDLGTANILVYVKGKGIVLNEPSVVAIDKKRNKILAVGEEAREMIGRAPGTIMAIRPLKEGVIANYTITQKLLAYVIDKVAGKSLFFKPRVMTCVPIGITSVEKRAVLEATMQGGASKTYLIEEPLAAAIGAGLDITMPRGNMVVDIGGGSTDIAVLSLGGIVVSNSVRIGGDHLDEDIINFVRKKYNVQIGDRTAEEIKISVGTVIKGNREEIISVRGRDMVSSLPHTIEVNSTDVCEALQDSVASIIVAVRGVFENCPPELASDIVDHGIYLTGGGALLDGLAQLIEEKTGIHTIVAENPLGCVVAGTGKALNDLDKLHPGTTYSVSNLSI